VGWMSRPITRIMGVAGVVLLVVSGATAGVAEPSARDAAAVSPAQARPATDRAALTSDTRFEVASANSFNELEAVAVAEGSVRAIVTLQMLWAPESMLGGVEQVAQVGTIDTIQQQLIDRVHVGEMRVVRRFKYIPVLALELDPGALSALEATGLAARVELDDIAVVALDESVPLIGGDGVHDLGYDGTGFSVAVLDTGVESSHTFFSGRVVGEACFSYLSDCPGGSVEQYGPGSAAPCTYSVTDCDHGTHVAGIAAGYDSPTFSGVAPGADIVAVQVFSDVGGAGSYASDQMAGLEYVYSVRDTYNVASVNMSIGGLPHNEFACDDQARKLAIDNLLAAGVATVIAAGNDSEDDLVSTPACISTAVTVGSSDKSDVRSGFSNWGEMVDLVAPGSNIESSVTGGGFDFKGGTSMATPHVAGAWALLKEAYPNAEVRDILAALQYSPTTVSAAGHTYPRIDLDDALALLGDPWPANDAFEDAASLSSPATLSGATNRATTQSWEPTSCTDPNDATAVTGISATIWYELVVPYDTDVTISTAGSGFDTTLGLYMDAAGSPYVGPHVEYLTPVACNDDYNGDLTSQVTASVAGGDTYWLQVGGWDGFVGALNLDVSDAGDMSDPPFWTSTTLTASNVLTDEMTVSWPAASDDNAVIGYRVYVNGALAGTTSSLSYTITGLQANTAYQVKVEAYDFGDHRTAGPDASITTARDFLDTDGQIFEEAIEWLSGSGITQGCNPPVNDMFCPNDNVTRGQMAAFLVRALGLTDHDMGIDFVDDNGNIFEENIEILATAGITKGCNPPVNDMFCPNDNVTRGQMAAFLVRALGLTDHDMGIDFVDDNGNVFEENIEILATAGITKGCNPPVNDMFCPNDNVTRGQMAAFLQRALGD